LKEKMKKILRDPSAPIFGTLLLGTLCLIILLIIPTPKSSYKYEITTPGINGWYRVNSYEKIDDRCIEFEKNKRTITLCGTYEIKKVKDEKKEGE